MSATGPKHAKPDLPELDRAEDPRGAAVAWALLVVAVAMPLVVGILLAAVGR